MATKILPRYASNTIFTPWGISYADTSPTTGAAPTSGWIGQNQYSLLTSQGSSAYSQFTTLSAGSSGVTIPSQTQPRFWASDPLAEDVTISGTVSLNIRFSESGMTSNVTPRIVVYRYDNFWTRQSTVLDSTYGTEVGTSETTCAWTDTPTSTAFSNGDRIVMVVVAAPVGTMGSGSGTVFFNGSSGGSGDTFISFTETFSFETATPSGSTYYLTNNTPTIDVTGIQEALESSRDAGVTNNALTNPTKGVRTQWTKTAGGTVMEWYTPPLEAFTLSGPVLVHLWSGYATGPTGLEVELSVHQGDGTLRAITGKTLGFAVSGSGSTLMGEFVITGGYSVSNGDRIRLRLYGNTVSSGFVSSGTSYIYYAGNTPSASGDSYLVFTETLSEYSAPGGGDDPMPYTGGGYYS